MHLKVILVLFLFWTTSCCATEKKDGCIDWESKQSQLESDIKLFSEALRLEPTNDRYMFHLAQSYFQMEQYEKAIIWYQAKIDRGGWKDETWYSIYKIGESYRQLGEWDKALHYFLTAYDLCPERAEPLASIATYYRINNQHYLACLFAMHGKAIPFPKNNTLFVSDSVYDYRFDEELSISAYYTPLRNTVGLDAINRLIENPNTPEDVKELAQKNIKFYTNS